MKAIWGDKWKTAAEEEAEFKEFQKKVAAMSDEEFYKEFGYTRAEEKLRTDKMLDEIHWYDCIIKHHLDAGIKPKVVYKMRDVAAIAKYFYFKGREHQSAGKDFDFNGNEVPLSEGWEEKKKEG